MNAVFPRARRWRWTCAALIAVLALALALGTWSSGTDQISTARGERQVAVLQDGSRIELNALTTIEVELRRDLRRVRLTRGEALFAVANDPTRPFIVETRSGSIRVTGTVFNVRAWSTVRMEVAVLEGDVRVQPIPAAAGKPAVVTAGRRAFVEAGRVKVRALPDGSIEDTVAWRQGRVVFEDTPLAEAFERFAAYHDAKILVEPAVADLRLGGRYGLDDLDGLLDTIERVLPVKVRREQGAVRVTRGGR